MSGTNLLWVVLVAAGLWLAVVVGRLLVAWLQFRRLRFSTASAQVADRAGMPAELLEVMATAQARLVELGFEYCESLLVEPQLHGIEQAPIWVDVYRHGASGHWALVQPAEAPEAGMLTAVTFLAIFENETVATENRRQHLLLPSPPDYRSEDALASTVADQWAFHCRRVEGRPAPLGDLASFHRHRVAMHDAAFAYAGECGWGVTEGGRWRFSAIGAWRLLRQVLAGQRRLARLPPIGDADEPATLLQADLHAWRNQEALLHGNTMSMRGKILWFVGSALVGVATFAYMTSWTVVPVLVGVLLFHEFGHALAMRAVGYRNLGVLMLPFLGAVAVGRKDDAGPWQKLIVLLAGPLPGLIVAMVLLLGVEGSREPNSLLFEISMIALWLNLFNLLPLMPLDGGQIVDTFLFARLPYLRLVFQAASALGLIAVGLFLESTPLAAIGLVLLTTLPYAWRAQRLLAASRRDGALADPAARLLKQLHQAAGMRPMPFAQRIQTVRALLPQISGRMPSALESLGGMSAYVAVLLLPWGALWHTSLPQDMAAQMTAPSQRATPAAEPAPDWSAQLAAARDPEQRWEIHWQAGQWYEDAEDDEQAEHHYRAALAEAQHLVANAANELHRLDTRIALLRFEGDFAVLDRLLPELRRLPQNEQWRLADVLETAVDALEWQDEPPAAASVDQRIVYLREAIGVRESLAKDRYMLYRDRSNLARLLDARGNAAGAEALLRKSLAEQPANGTPGAMGPVSDFAWFMATRQRAAEGEAAIRAHGFAGHAQMASVLAWMRRSQGDPVGARQILAEAEAWFASNARSGWSWQRMEILLDLISASADAPAEQARWLKEIEAIKTRRGRQFNAFCRSYAARASGRATPGWADARDEARRAAALQIQCPTPPDDPSHQH